MAFWSYHVQSVSLYAVFYSNMLSNQLNYDESGKIFGYFASAQSQVYMYTQAGQNYHFAYLEFFHDSCFSGSFGQRSRQNWHKSASFHLYSSLVTHKLETIRDLSVFNNSHISTIYNDFYLHKNMCKIVENA